MKVDVDDRWEISQSVSISLLNSGNSRLASCEGSHMRTIASVLIFAVAPLLVADDFAARGAFLALFVPDLESSVTWYRDKLGLKVVDRPAASETVNVAILEGRGLIVELIQHKDAKPKPADVMHHGMFKGGVVVDDFEALVAMLKAAKVDIAYGPFPAREKQRANLLIRDNNGNLIQFFGH